MGALNSKEHLAKVESYIALAKQEGGTILCGGDKPQLAPEVSHRIPLPPFLTASRSLREAIG